MLEKREVLFSSAYNEYLLFRKRKLKEQTYSTFVYNFNANILSFFKDYNIYDINEQVIYKWQEEIEKKDFSNSHNRNLFLMLKGFFDYCYYKYGLDLSFMLEVFPFKRKIEKKEQDHYTLKEFRQFIECVDSEIYKQFFTFMFWTGTRPGETMALKFSDLDGKYISINKTMDEHGKRNIGTPKTLSSCRKLVLTQEVLEGILKLKDYYKSLYPECNDFYIFGGIKPLNPSTTNRRKKQACIKANIRPIKLHCFRHSHATLLMNEHLEWHEIAKRLGHASTKVTIDTYTHSNFEQEKRVEDTLNSLRKSKFSTPRKVFENFISILKHK